MALKVAFLGIGLMGLPMARNLLKGDYQLSVWNRSTEKAAVLSVDGAEIAQSAVEAVRDAQVIISMLADGQVVNQLADELIESGAIASGSLWIDMSSTQVTEAERMQAKLSAVGADFIDAPVSGGVKGAEDATLAIMAGANPTNFTKALPILNCLGRAVRVGEPGAGQVAKLANQSMVAAYIAATSEATLLCESYGVDTAAFRDALKGGFADSSVLQIHGRRMAERDFTPGAKVTTQVKDMNNVLGAAKARNITLPLAESLRRGYAALAENPARAVADHSALFLELLDKNQRT